MLRVNSRGTALMIAVTCISVLSALSIAFVQLTVQRSGAALESVCSADALGVLEAGIALKCHEIEVSSDLASRTYRVPVDRLQALTVTVTVSSVAADVFYLRGTTTYGDPTAGRSVDRTVEVVATRERVSRPFARGFLGKDRIQMNGNTRANSFDSDVAPYDPLRPGSAAKLASNGPVTTGKNAVRGDLYLGPSGSFRSPGGVTGEIRSLPAEAFVLEPVDATRARLCNDNLSISPGTAYDATSGSLTLSNGARAVMGPGTYYFSDVSLTGGSTLELSATVDKDRPVAIFVTGTFDCSGGTIVNPTKIPSTFQLYVAGTEDVAVSGGSDFYGLIYAPYSEVSITGGSNFYGAIVAQSLVIAGDTGLHFDEAAQWVSPVRGRKTAVVSWRELWQ